MSIISGQIILAEDYINDSERDAVPANDAGRVPKLETDAKVARTFIRSSFGGNGADGALVIVAGATNIDLLGAKVVIKNYTSISITGTGSLTFSNPHSEGTVIVLKSQGDVVLTSSTAPMIDVSAMGANGAPSNTYSSNGNFNGSGGSQGSAGNWLDSGSGGGGTASSPGVGGTGGVASLIPYRYPLETLNQQVIFSKYGFLICGGGGGEGAGERFDNGNVITGGGGRGGGSLVIECAGGWNFTTIGGISCAGQNGGNAGGTSTRRKAGGGGGGGGGAFLGLYNTLIANTGTVLSAGGSGGSGASDTSGGAFGQNVGAGGGGASYASGTAGAGNSNAPTGGAGGIGSAFIGANTEIV